MIIIPFLYVHIQFKSILWNQNKQPSSFANPRFPLFAGTTMHSDMSGIMRANSSKQNTDWIKTMTEFLDKFDEILDSRLLIHGKLDPSFLENSCTGIEPIQSQNNWPFVDRSEVVVNWKRKQKLWHECHAEVTHVQLQNVPIIRNGIDT